VFDKASRGIKSQQLFTLTHKQPFEASRNDDKNTLETVKNMSLG